MCLEEFKKLMSLLYSNNQLFIPHGDFNSWVEEVYKAQMNGFTQELVYEGKAKHVNSEYLDNEKAVWTDGVSFCTDGENHAAYELEVGQKYKVVLYKKEDLVLLMNARSSGKSFKEDSNE